MSDSEMQRLIALLEEIRSNQRVQLEHQAEALTLQREQFAIVLKQHERTERIQDRAEAIQAKSAQLVAGSRKLFALIVPALIALLIYVSWLIFRH
jgi:hypothetical protein